MKLPTNNSLTNQTYIHLTESKQTINCQKTYSYDLEILETI